MSTQPGQTPPIVLPSQLNLATAQLCAVLTNAAYDQFSQWAKQGYPPPASFQWKPSGPTNLKYSTALWGNAVVLGYSNWEPFGFVAADSAGNAYVAFRGTMTKADEWNDADISHTAYKLVTNPSFGSVANGFYSIYTTRLNSQIPSLRDATNAAVTAFAPKVLYVTGHSLGAALCTLTVPDASYNIAVPTLGTVSFYNFASPRVGDTGFADGMNNQVNKHVVSLQFRVVNTEDEVPTLPPPEGVNVYEHVGTPVSFTAQYLTLSGNHSMAGCYTYAINNPKYPQGPQPAFVNAVTGIAIELAFAPQAMLIPALAN